MAVKSFIVQGHGCNIKVPSLEPIPVEPVWNSILMVRTILVEAPAFPAIIRLGLKVSESDTHFSLLWHRINYNFKINFVRDTRVETS